MTRSVLKFWLGSALLALMLIRHATAQAQTQGAPVIVGHGPESGAGLGVGAAAFVSGLAGLDVVYDLPRFHVEGILGFSSLDNVNNGNNNQTITAFQFGARGWYHLHVGQSSDFSLGGGLGVRTVSGGGQPSATATLIEPGMQARVFLTPNFTLNFTGGLSLVFGDSTQNATKGFGLGTQLLGGIGFSYFFR